MPLQPPPEYLNGARPSHPRPHRLSEAQFAEQCRATERRITAAILSAFCIVGFAWMAMIVLQAFPETMRGQVELLSGEILLVAFCVLAVWKAFRG